MSDDTPPEPQGNSKRFALFHKSGDKNKYWANIVMPNGHREVFDTGARKKLPAQAAAAARVRALYKELGIETPKEKRTRTGELSPYLQLKQKRAAANGVAHEGQRPLPPGPHPLAPASEDWAESVVKIEDKFAKAFFRIQGLLLLRGADDADSFLEHVRAIVVETTLGAVTKPRAPWGSKKRVRPPAD